MTPKAPPVPLPFECRGHARRYRTLRAVPRPVLSLYLKAILSTDLRPRRVLDIGAGTGQFTVALASALPRATIESLEPAEAMRMELHRRVARARLRNVKLTPLPLESFSDDATFDLLVLSEVIHLLGDPVRVVDRIVRLVRPGGTIAIRTSSQAQLRSRDWYRFFPSAKLVDMHRHPSLDLLSEALTQRGLSVSEAVVDESRPLPTALLLRMFEQRAFSTLHLIDKKEFQRGLQRLSLDVRGAAHHYFDYRMTLLTARS